MLTQSITLPGARSERALFKGVQFNAPISDSTRFGRLSVVKKISDAKFPIYLVSSSINNQNYIVKTFNHPYEDSETSYKNESRVASLRHPNLISFINFGQDKEILPGEGLGKVPYVLMEYAPYGDLFDFIINYKGKIEEKLIRTYFRQLINGLEYLHGNGIAHLDLKPENILIGADYNTKICDFDLSHMSGDAQVLSKGTRYYRAPELFMTAGSSSSSSHQSDISFAADIYSVGVILFLLKTQGFYPHNEEDDEASIHFLELMYKNNSKFWKRHSEIQGKESFFEPSFIDLFNGMTSLDPKDRMSIQQIKKSKWYNEPTYTPAELIVKMNKLLNH